MLDDIRKENERLPAITPHQEVPGGTRDSNPLGSPAKRKVVVVHAGARDAYQVARALSEAGMLEALVTDLFWPADKPWVETLARRLPASLYRLLRQRSESGIPFCEIKLRFWTGLRTLLLEKTSLVSGARRQSAQRAADATLGRTAGRLAARKGAALLSYSYYGFDAFKNYPSRGMLFQVHPHPATVRRILQQELAMNPDCAGSLEQEWELALPPQDFDHLVEETRLAGTFLAASSFTRDSLVANGVSAKAVTVIPYGVNLEQFRPGERPVARGGKLQLLFVGRINQRKGIKYLLEALRLLPPHRVHLTICGRVVDDLKIFETFRSQVDIRPSVTAAELVSAYQQADLFVFPSVAEGFGQVLLEALACGLPILSTTHTAAPDLITEGEQGFVVEPRRPDLLASRIETVLSDPSRLSEMRASARKRAELFTWDLFRKRVVQAVAAAIEADEAI